MPIPVKCNLSVVDEQHRDYSEYMIAHQIYYFLSRKFNRNIQLSVTLETNRECSVIAPLHKLARYEPVANLQR